MVTSIRGILGLAVVLAAMVAIGFLASAAWHAVQDPRPLVLDLLSRFDSPADPGDARVRAFAVREGETAGVISDRLEAAGLVRDALVFRLMAEIEGMSTDLAAGEYELSPSMRPSEILGIIATAKTRLAPLLTIPEGWRAEEIAERIAARGIGPAGQFMELVREGNSELAALAGRQPGDSLEGYLFPDSYSIDARSTPESMVRRMAERFDAQFTPEMREKAAALGMSVHEIVTLASVIEREAVIPSERPLMAGVFYNRLRDGIKLQSDPTVQYAVAMVYPESQERYGWWKTMLTLDDLEIDSPYNSYRYPGLPPGPICNPGLASLRAALEPASTGYLYFVARPDGSHAFAETLEEHNANVARYR